jgi:hypothetical protein
VLGIERNETAGEQRHDGAHERGDPVALGTEARRRGCAHVTSFVQVEGIRMPVRGFAIERARWHA